MMSDTRSTNVKRSDEEKRNTSVKRSDDNKRNSNGEERRSDANKRSNAKEKRSNDNKRNSSEKRKSDDNTRNNNEERRKDEGRQRRSSVLMRKKLNGKRGKHGNAPFLRQGPKVADLTSKDFRRMKSSPPLMMRVLRFQ